MKVLNFKVWIPIAYILKEEIFLNYIYMYIESACVRVCVPVCVCPGSTNVQKAAT